MSAMNARIVLVVIMMSAAMPLPAAVGAPAASQPSLDALADATPAQIKSYFASPQYSSLKRSDGDFVRDVFRVVLRREPDADGRAAWLAALKNGRDPAATRANMVAKALESPEYQGKHPAHGETAPAKPEMQDTTRNPHNVIFDRTGVFVNDATAFPPDLYAARMKTARVAWIALQIDNGGKTRDDSAAAIEKGWMRRWRAAGFKVGFWGCPRGVAQHGTQAAVEQATPNVKADAELAVSLAAKYHADLYIADPEDSFQGYNPTDPTPALNRVYVDAFKAAAASAGISDMPRALSSEGRIALDMKPWIDAGWDALPQAYWNSYAVYQPSKCVDFYRSTGWPIARIHPTIGTFSGEGENRKVSLEDYEKDLKSTSAVGFSYYLPESYLKSNDAAYRQLAKMGARTTAAATTTTKKTR
jgi:Domain of unknown function (DUF4214)